jgi:hypothetical protein
VVVIDKTYGFPKEAVSTASNPTKFPTYFLVTNNSSSGIREGLFVTAHDTPARTNSRNPDLMILVIFFLPVIIWNDVYYNRLYPYALSIAWNLIRYINVRKFNNLISVFFIFKILPPDLFQDINKQKPPDKVGFSIEHI